MKLTIESTDIQTTIDGVKVRLWEGVTESGIPVKVFVHRLAVRDDHDSSAFEAELEAVAVPAEIRRAERLQDLLWRSTL